MNKVYLVVAVVLIGIIVIISSQNRNDSTEENDIIEESVMANLEITSTAFAEGETIPSQYTCDGDNISPPLQISGVPEGAKSLTLIMDDPDIPEVVKKSRLIEKFDHWVLFNLPSDTTELEEDHKGVGLSGSNSTQGVGYVGPCPPPEYEPTEHRYIFQLYALDTTLELQEGATESDVRGAMKGHILEKAELIGVYDRANKN